MLAYSLKCPLYPEWSVITPSAVLAMERAFKLCTGLLDGSINVHLLRSKEVCERDIDDCDLVLKLLANKSFLLFIH